MIFGIDEVGRGALAGPVAVGVVGLGEAKLLGLTDSKKLTAKRRTVVAHDVKLKARQASLGWVSAKMLDQIGMTAALKLAIERALVQLNIEDDDQIIIDGTYNFLAGTRYEPITSTLKQADLVIPSVSAASILAKVARDNYMRLVDQRFSEYGFAVHAGYGTKKHLEAIDMYGASPIHRLSFAPMKMIPEKKVGTGHIQTVGGEAEEQAVKYLQQNGYEILSRNWRTKWCEIDIVAQKNGQLYFVEVKYRSTHNQGDGLSYVTAAKQRQMRYAAEFWLHTHPKETQRAREINLSAVGLTGPEMRIAEFIDRI